MDWVAEGIAVGGLRDTLDHDRLRSEGIEAVLQLYGADRERATIPIPVELLQLSLMDRQPLPPALLRRGVDFIRRQREAGRPLLVACGAGISRSPTFVAAYLHEQGTDLVEAYRLIRTARPVIRPHRAMVRSLVSYYHLPEAVAEELARHAR